MEGKWSGGKCTIENEGQREVYNGKEKEFKAESSILGLSIIVKAGVQSSISWSYAERDLLAART